MGAKSSASQKQLEINHQKFSTVRQISEDEIETCVRVLEEDYNSWKANLKKINSFNKDNIVYPLNHSFSNEGWCSQNTGKAKITYDNYPYIFAEELQNRISLSRHLSEQEMWYLLYTMVNTAKEFSFLNRKVGDIRPHNIFISEVGQIKLAVCFSWPSAQNNYEKAFEDREVTYISPEQVEMCRNEKMGTLVNNVLAESFSIGLTMLHAGLLFNVETLYSMKQFEMNLPLLNEKLDSWMSLKFKDDNEDGAEAEYSQELKHIVKDLCHPDPHSRESSLQIYRLLQEHHDQILNLEPFKLVYKQAHTVSHSHQTNHLQNNSFTPKNNFGGFATAHQQQTYRPLDPISNPQQFSFDDPSKSDLPQYPPAARHNTYSNQFQSSDVKKPATVAMTEHVSTPYNVSRNTATFEVFDRYANSKNNLYLRDDNIDRSTEKGGRKSTQNLSHSNQGPAMNSDLHRDQSQYSQTEQINRYSYQGFEQQQWAGSKTEKKIVTTREAINTYQVPQHLETQQFQNDSSSTRIVGKNVVSTSQFSVQKSDPYSTNSFYEKKLTNEPPSGFVKTSEKGISEQQTFHGANFTLQHQPSVPRLSSKVEDGPTDEFLRQLDEQILKSRKLFPS